MTEGDFVDMGRVSPVLKEPIDLLVHQLRNGQVDKSATNRVAEEFLANHKKLDNPDDVALMTLMFLSFFGEDLTKPTKDKMHEIHNVSRSKAGVEGVVQTVLISMDVLNQEIHLYLRNPGDYDYWYQFVSLNHPLANLILKLERNRIASVLKGALEKQGETGAVVQTFNHPKGGEPGIWLSMRGKPLDMAKINKSTHG